MQVSEKDNSIQLKFILYMEWRDVRLTFENLQSDYRSNLLTKIQESSIWYPVLLYANTVDNDLVLMDGESQVNVIRNGNLDKNVKPSKSF